MWVERVESQASSGAAAHYRGTSLLVLARQRVEQRRLPGTSRPDYRGSERSRRSGGDLAEDPGC
jgi:hypothetical protein